MIVFRALSEKHVCVVFAGLLLPPVVQSLFPGGQRVRRCRGNKQTPRDFNAEALYCKKVRGGGWGGGGLYGVREIQKKGSNMDPG